MLKLELKSLYIHNMHYKNCTTFMCQIKKKNIFKIVNMSEKVPNSLVIRIVHIISRLTYT